MSVHEDGGIVDGYLRRFMQLGVKAQAGHDIEGQVAELSREARNQLDVWKTGDPVENRRRLCSALRRKSNLIASTSPAQAKVLMDGVALLAIESEQ